MGKLPFSKSKIPVFAKEMLGTYLQFRLPNEERFGRLTKLELLQNISHKKNVIYHLRSAIPASPKRKTMLSWSRSLHEPDWPA